MKRFELAFACRADFGTMPAVAGGRHCSDCNRIVHDLSALDEAATRAPGPRAERTPPVRESVAAASDADAGPAFSQEAAGEPVELEPETASE